MTAKAKQPHKSPERHGRKIIPGNILTLNLVFLMRHGSGEDKKWLTWILKFLINRLYLYFLPKYLLRL